jgi:acyl carrier protein
MEMATTMNNVQQRVIKAIAEVLERKESEIGLGASLRDDLGCDSLKQMTLFIVLEDEFQRTMPPEDLVNIVTVKDVIDFIDRKLQEPAPT